MKKYTSHGLGDESQGLLDDLLQKARDLKDFRRRLINNPRKVIFEETGILVPENLRVLFENKQGEGFTLFLPQLQLAMDGAPMANDPEPILCRYSDTPPQCVLDLPCHMYDIPDPQCHMEDLCGGTGDVNP